MFLIRLFEIALLYSTICEIFTTIYSLGFVKYNLINIELTCATIENSEQPLHPRSLIRVFDGRSMDIQWPKFLKADN